MFIYNENLVEMRNKFLKNSQDVGCACPQCMSLYVSSDKYFFVALFNYVPIFVNNTLKFISLVEILAFCLIWELQCSETNWVEMIMVTLLKHLK